MLNRTSASWLILAGSLQLLAGCETGPVPAGTHRSADASTGSMLSGADTGASSGDLAGPSIGNLNQSGAPGGH